MTSINKVLIGWSTRDITPDRPVNLLGQWNVRISRGTHDPVTVTALSVSSGEDAFIWVSCDLCVITEEVLAQCRRKLRQRLPEFPSEKLIMSATHTHTAPEVPGPCWYPPVPAGVMTPAEYGTFLSDRVVEAAAESWNARKPGAIGWGYGYAVAGHSRRVVYFNDLNCPHVPGMTTEKNARMYGNTNDPQFSNMEGYVDHGINILFTFDEGKKLTGAVFNLPCPSQETMNDMWLSADFWHEVRLELRKRHGENLFVLPQCAPAGDLSPTLLYNQKAEQRMRKLKNRTSRQELANRLAVAFDEIYPWARNDLHEEVVLKHSVRTLSLGRRFISEEEFRNAKAGFAALDKIPPSSAPNAAQPLRWEESADVCFARKVRCRRILERYEEQKQQSNLSMELHVVRLGDIVFATNSFELFLDFGMRIIGRSPAVQTFLVQLAAGGIGSYLPTAKAEAGGGYSANLYCNEVGPLGGQQLVDETVKTMNELWAS